MNIEPLAYWMEERHRIYLRRQAGEFKPWTTDPVLRSYRFCNVFRELDTVTEWIRINIRDRYANHEYLWLMLCIARHFNWPETLDTLIHAPGAWPSHPDFDPANMTEVLAARQSLGDKVYTGAYMIRGENNKGVDWYYWPKVKYSAEGVLGQLWRDREKLTREFEDSVTLQDACGILQRYRAWGPFLSYEVATDMRHTRYLSDAADIYTWANPGPGARRGLNRLAGRSLNKRLSEAQCVEEMRWLQDELNALNRSGFNEVFGEPGARFEMRDIEHSLCETDKHLRVKNGEGRIRSKYNGESDEH